MDTKTIEKTLTDLDEIEQRTQHALAEIERLTPEVAREDEEHRAALEKEQVAEADALACAIAIARPALRAVASRIQIAHTSGMSGIHSVEDEE